MKILDDREYRMCIDWLPRSQLGIRQNNDNHTQIVDRDRLIYRVAASEIGRHFPDGIIGRLLLYHFYYQDIFLPDKYFRVNIDEKFAQP